MRCARGSTFLRDGRVEASRRRSQGGYHVPTQPPHWQHPASPEELQLRPHVRGSSRVVQAFDPSWAAYHLDSTLVDALAVVKPLEKMTAALYNARGKVYM